MAFYESSFRKETEETSKRKVRRKFETHVGLSITSLLDILTILLVFLIKNVSIEAQKVTSPDNMRLPTTITNQELLQSGLTVVVKMYPDRILVGIDNLPVGSLRQLVEDKNTRETIYNYLKHEASQIETRNKKDKTDFQPCLLIQADKQIVCQYITQMVKIGAGAAFANIYFSTLQNENWLKATAQSLP